MDDQFPTATVEANHTPMVESLAERMDLSIGEASTVIGSVLTELMRRSLRGGVMQIGEQLHDFVTEKVDATIVERTPVIEQVAVEVADKTARTAATEVAKDEVQYVSRKADELGQQLHGKIELAEKKAELAAAGVTMELTNQLKDTEKRLIAAAHEDALQQLQEYRDRARQGVVLMKGRVKRLDAALEALGKKLTQEQDERRTHVGAVEERLQHAELERQAIEQQLRQELARVVESVQAQVRVEEEKLKQQIVALNERVVDLERPGAFRRLLQRLAFWRKAG